MDLLKIIGIGLLGVIVVNVLKSANSEFSVLGVIATGIVILISILSSLTEVLKAFDDIITACGINDGLYLGVMKIIGVAYITEYSANICKDSGSESIGNKLLLGGKVGIFLMALPIVKALISVVSSLSL